MVKPLHLSIIRAKVDNFHGLFCVFHVSICQCHFYVHPHIKVDMIILEKFVISM